MRRRIDARGLARFDLVDHLAADRIDHRDRDVGEIELAAVGEGGERVRQLQRRHTQIALADGDVDRVTCPPSGVGEGLRIALVAGALDLGVGHDPGVLEGQRDAGRLAETEVSSRLLDLVVDVAEAVRELLGQFVEVDVAGHCDGHAKVDVAVGSAVGILELAFPDAVRQDVKTGIGRGLVDPEEPIRSDQARGQGRVGGDGLHGRPGRVHTLDRPIVEGSVARRVQERGELVLADPADEHARVVVRVAGHRQDVAGARIQYDDGARRCQIGDEALLHRLVLTFTGFEQSSEEFVLHELLEVRVDGQHHIGTGLGRPVPALSDHVADVVDLDLPPPGVAPQDVLESELNTRLPDLVHGAVALRVVLARLEFFCGDGVDVPQNVRRQITVGVDPLGALDDLDPGELLVALGQEHLDGIGDTNGKGDQVERSVAGVGHGLGQLQRLGERPRAGELSGQFEGQALPLSAADLIPQDERVHGDHVDGAVSHQFPSPHVEDAAARCGLGNRADDVPDGLRHELLRRHHLQVPETHHQRGEQGHADHAHDAESQHARVVTAEPSPPPAGLLPLRAAAPIGGTAGAGRNEGAHRPASGSSARGQRDTGRVVTISLQAHRTSRSVTAARTTAQSSTTPRVAMNRSV